MRTQKTLGNLARSIQQSEPRSSKAAPTTNLLAAAKAARERDREEEEERAGTRDYRQAVPAKLISSSTDIKRMLADLKREQARRAFMPPVPESPAASRP